MTNQAAVMFTSRATNNAGVGFNPRPFNNQAWNWSRRQLVDQSAAEQAATLSQQDHFTPSAVTMPGTAPAPLRSSFGQGFRATGPSQPAEGLVVSQKMLSKLFN